MQRSALYPQRPIRRRGSHNRAVACYLSWLRLPNSNEPQMSPAVPICKARNLFGGAGHSTFEHCSGEHDVFERNVLEHSVFGHREEQ